MSLLLLCQLNQLCLLLVLFLHLSFSFDLLLFYLFLFLFHLFLLSFLNLLFKITINSIKLNFLLLLLSLFEILFFLTHLQNLLFWQLNKLLYKVPNFFVLFLPQDLKQTFIVNTFMAKHSLQIYLFLLQKW